MLSPPVSAKQRIFMIPDQLEQGIDDDGGKDRQKESLKAKV